MDSVYFAPTGSKPLGRVVNRSCHFRAPTCVFCGSLRVLNDIFYISTLVWKVPPWLLLPLLALTDCTPFRTLTAACEQIQLCWLVSELNRICALYFLRLVECQEVLAPPTVIGRNFQTRTKGAGGQQLNASSVEVVLLFISYMSVLTHNLSVVNQ